MLYIRGHRIFSEQGELLKEISCPKKVTADAIEASESGCLNCSSCNKEIINTDIMSELELIDLLKRDPETCLTVSLLNPMFEIS